MANGLKTDWASAMATLSTTFQQLQTAQIDWNGTKRTASFHLSDMKIALGGRVQNIQEVSVKATLSDPSDKPALTMSG